MKRIAILADTHGLLRPEVKEYLENCDAILHAGDINKPELMRRMAEYAPFYAVCGNADETWAETEGLRRTIRPELFGLKFYLIHNKKQITEDLSDRDIIISGHTHKYEEKTLNGQLWLNPGTCGPRRRTMPITMAILETEGDGTYQVTKIDIPHPEEKKKSGEAEKKSPGKADGKSAFGSSPAEDPEVTKTLIAAVIREINAGKSVEKIAKNHGMSTDLTEELCRLTLTHPGIDADGVYEKYSS